MSVIHVEFNKDKAQFKDNLDAMIVTLKETNWGWVTLIGNNDDNNDSMVHMLGSANSSELIGKLHLLVHGLERRILSANLFVEDS